MKKREIENLIVNGYLAVYVILAITGVFIPLIKYFSK